MPALKYFIIPVIYHTRHDNILCPFRCQQPSSIKIEKSTNHVKNGRFKRFRMFLRVSLLGGNELGSRVDILLQIELWSSIEITVSVARSPPPRLVEPHLARS